jgi:hypothetical protein
MSYGMKAVSKYRRCPICGKTDWCGFYPAEDIPGGELVICMRDTDKCNIEGYDGNRYVYISVSRNGNSVFEEYEQYQARTKGKKTEMMREYAPKREVQLTPVGIIEPEKPEYCDKIYRFMQSQLHLEERHRTYLLSNGWTDELIAYHNIVSFPEPDFLRVQYKNRTRSKNPYRKTLAASVIERFGEKSLEGIPGAYIQKGKWTFYGPSGILFPMYDFDGNMFRLRIRKDFMDVQQQIIMLGDTPYYYQDNTKYFICMKGIYSKDREANRCFMDTRGKYRTLSSFVQDEAAIKQGFFANIFEKGCQSLNEASMYTKPGDNMDVWFVTEGEPKAIFTNDKLKAPIISIPGVNSYGLLLNPQVLEKLKKYGMKMVVIIFDADKVHNDKVLTSEMNLVEGLKKLNIPTAIGDWDENIGKGCDDMLAAGGQIIFRIA